MLLELVMLFVVLVVLLVLYWRRTNTSLLPIVLLVLLLQVRVLLVALVVWLVMMIRVEHVGHFRVSIECKLDLIVAIILRCLVRLHYQAACEMLVVLRAVLHLLVLLL